MWNKLYRLSLVMILSINLLMLDFAYKGDEMRIILSQAQAVPTEAPTPSPTTSGPSGIVTIKGVKVDCNQYHAPQNASNAEVQQFFSSIPSECRDFVAQKQSQEFEMTHTVDGAKDKFGFGSIMETLTALLVGISLFFVPAKGPDVWVAKAGAVIYILGEIYAMTQFKGKVKAQVEKIKYTVGKSDQTQIQALNEMKSEFEDANKVLKKKIQLQKAVKAVYLAAAVTAAAYAAFSLGTCSSIFDLFKKIFDSIIPKAYAASLNQLFEATGLIGGLVLGTVAKDWLILNVLGEGTAYHITEVLMANCWIRAALWTSYAIFVQQAINKTDKTQDEMEDRIAKVDKIIEYYNKVAAGGTQLKVNQIETQAINVKTDVVKPDAVVPDALKLPMAFPCPDNSTGDCTSILTQTEKQVPLASFGTGMQSFLTSSLKTADAITGSQNISSGTIGSAMGLSSALNAISNLHKKTLDKLNASRVKKGQKPINIESEAQKLARKISDGIKKDLVTKGLSSKDFNFLANSSSLGSSLDSKEKDLEKLAEKANIKLSGPVVKTEAKKEEKVDDKFGNFDFNFDDKKATEVAKLNPEAAEKVEYETNDSAEIHDASGPSLFDILSSRYRQSGYDRLLELDK